MKMCIRDRLYTYTCYVGETKPVFNRKYVTVLDGKPDVEAMRRAAEFLVGEHDFRSFCANPQMKKSTVRIVDCLLYTSSSSWQTRSARRPAA